MLRDCGAVFRPRAGEPQSFFSTPDSSQAEQLQRRARGLRLGLHLAAVAHLALHHPVRHRRSRPRGASARRTAGESDGVRMGLAALGIASMPVSWLLLEQWKWALVPQIQPLRCAAVRGLGACSSWRQSCACVRGRASWRPLAGSHWLICCRADCVDGRAGSGRMSGLAVALAAATVLARECASRRCRSPLFSRFRWLGGVVNYPRLHTPELAQLSRMGAMPRRRADAVFRFPRRRPRARPRDFPQPRRFARSTWIGRAEAR